MQIIWYGESCFKIISGEISLLTDPFSPEKRGFKNPRFLADLFLFSSFQELDRRKERVNNFFSFFTPGEYEIKNIFIQGIPHQEKGVLKTIYLIELENIKICFLSKISKFPSQEHLKKISKSEIILIPFNFISKEGVGFIKGVQPKLVVPFDLFLTKEEKIPKVLEKFAQEIGSSKVEILEKLKIKKRDLSWEKSKLVILKPNI